MTMPRRQRNGSTASGDAAMATKQNVYGLINRIKDFSEWSQVTILEVVALYSPASSSAATHSPWP